jgi:hypothetical protein
MRFLIKLQSPRPDGVALAFGRFQVVFTKHMLSCSESSRTLNSVRTVLPSVRTIACCLHRRVCWAVQNLLEHWAASRHFTRPSEQSSCILFISFPMTPISSQSNTWVESYDKNTETCAESSWKPKNCLLDACDTDTCHIKALSILEK